MNDRKNIVLLTNKIERPGFCHLSEQRDRYVLVIFQTPVLFSYDNKKYFPIPADSLIIYRPTTIQCYKSEGEILQNSFIYLEEDESYFQQFNIPLDVVINLKKDRVEELVFELDRISYIVNTPYAKSLEDKVSEYINDFFALLSKYIDESNLQINGPSIISSLLIIRGLMFEEPEKYTVRRMAYEVGFTETYFGIKYKEAFYITPNQDRKIQLIKKIKKYLKETDYTLDMIAELCLIKSTAHLINMFKSVEHITPYQYKKSLKNL